MSAASDLQQFQTSQGAIYGEGQALPSHFGDSEKEFRAAKNDLAVFDLTGRTQLELTGADRQKFLHSFCTNDVRNLKAGQSCEAFVPTIQGKIWAHIFVFAEDASLWIDSVPGFEDRLFAHLDKYLISEKVQFHRRSVDFTEFYLSGPQSAVRLNELGLPARGVELHRHFQANLDTIPVSVRRVDWLKELGFLICVPTAHATAAWKALSNAQIQPAGQDVFESLRILAMFPQYGVDLTENNLAQEAAHTDRAISFNKGCYLGQETIARIDSMGHVNQELRGLRLASGPLPKHLAKVVMPGEVREAGVVTSSAWDYSTGEPVALAVLKRNYMSSGQQLMVLVEDQEAPATVFDRS
jgi:folate-binding protein YgfZ